MLFHVFYGNVILTVTPLPQPPLYSHLSRNPVSTFPCTPLPLRPCSQTSCNHLFFVSCCLPVLTRRWDPRSGHCVCILEVTAVPVTVATGSKYSVEMNEWTVFLCRGSHLFCQEKYNPWGNWFMEFIQTFGRRLTGSTPKMIPERLYVPELLRNRSWNNRIFLCLEKF